MARIPQTSQNKSSWMWLITANYTMTWIIPKPLHTSVSVPSFPLQIHFIFLSFKNGTTAWKNPVLVKVHLKVRLWECKTATLCSLNRPFKNSNTNVFLKITAADMAPVQKFCWIACLSARRHSNLESFARSHHEQHTVPIFLEALNTWLNSLIAYESRKMHTLD